MTQTAINAGTLVMWNKGFTAAGVVGHDVVELLQTQPVARHQPEGEGARERPVGTMEAAAYANPDTTMGVILGTGTNAAYIEKGSKLGKWKGPPCDEMVINTEWGNLDMSSVMNATDHFIDGASTNPGKQTFEKMVSGMYLGEICRVAVLSPEVLSGFSAGCQAELRAAFAGTGALKSALMSAIEADDTAELSTGRRAREAGVSSTTVRDRVLLRARRQHLVGAARLSAMGVASLLQLQEGTARRGIRRRSPSTARSSAYRALERMEADRRVRRRGGESVKLVLAKDGLGSAPDHRRRRRVTRGVRFFIQFTRSHTQSSQRLEPRTQNAALSAPRSSPASGRRTRATSCGSVSAHARAAFMSSTAAASFTHLRRARAAPGLPPQSSITA